jgi:hypothetical protein
LQLKLDCNYTIHLFFFFLEMSHGEGENHAKLDEKTLGRRFSRRRRTRFFDESTERFRAVADYT